MADMIDRTGGPVVLGLRDVRRTYRQAEREIHVLDGANISLAAGEAVALVGPSGSGKSTLLHISGLLETPDSGSIVINGTECFGLDDDRRTEMRRNQIGFIYQFH
ncbi:MAG TPA: ATP-binding cassette domain-containing protein, partial [Hyphomicrobiaceae bacterium]|nr:ATP-binding cassette domain-containing protein [Hyphomicrobiaceae bacterium]